MTTTILNKLHILKKTYRDYQQNCFEDWCAKYSEKFDVSKRLLVCNDALFKWYLNRWENLVEFEFLNDIMPYDREGFNDPETLRDFLFKYPVEIQAFYPINLLNKIKVQSQFINKMEKANDKN